MAGTVTGSVCRRESQQPRVSVEVDMTRGKSGSRRLTERTQGVENQGTTKSKVSFTEREPRENEQQQVSEEPGCCLQR